VKVLYIVTAYARHSGDVITPWLVETIHRLRSRGVDVEVLAPAYRGQPSQSIDGVYVHRFRYAPRAWETLTHDQTAPDRIGEKPLYLGLVPSYVAAGSLAAARLARTGDFDVVHAFWPIPHGVLGLAAKWSASVPLVSTFFGVELTWVESRMRLLKPVIRGIVRASDAVTAISSYTAGALRAMVPEAKVVTIPFGAAVERASPPAPAGAPAGAGGEAPFRLLFVGRLVERKGVHVLVEALALLRAEGRELRLDVVGEGPERERLGRLAAELGVERQVRFHGFVSPEALRERFSACDAFVLPAVIDAKGDTEGLGVVLIEALEHGKPVIASAAGGIPDIVRDGETGLLVPPGDPEALAGALRLLLERPDRAGELAERGRRAVEERFSWSAIIDRLEALYRETAGG
jgi:glycosyltransferase involved in cell wall biosynthesis